jgi:hypothetical protein
VRSAILGKAKVSWPLGDDRLVGIKKFEDDLPLEWIDTRASPCPSFFLLREFSRTFLGANVLGLFIRGRPHDPQMAGDGMKLFYDRLR